MSLYRCVHNFVKSNTFFNKSNLLQLKGHRYMGNTSDMKPILYYDNRSPPVRFVLMTASCLEVKLDLHEINLFKNENLNEDYKKINPLGKVPAMKVNNETIVDSHAICLYLCGMYDNNGRLYPKDPITRAKVDEMLFFNSSTLFPIDSTIFSAYFGGKYASVGLERSKWTSAINFLEQRLQDHTWLSGDQMTLSDLCCAATISSLELLIPTEDSHPEVQAWLKRVKEQPFYEVNNEGLKRLEEVIKPTQ